MFPKVLLLSLLSALATLLFLHVGLGVLRLAPKARLNRVFACICLAFAVWSLGFTFLPSAQPPDTWFWLALSSPGWTFGPSLLLHFFLLLAGRQAWLERRWVLPALYAPAVFFMTQALRGPGHMGVVRFLPTTWGWSMVYGALTPTYAAYLVFFPAFILFGLGLVYRSGRRATLFARRRQALLLASTGAAVLPIVALSGIYLPWLGFHQLPIVSHLIAGLWVLAIRYAMSQYQFMTLSPAIAAQDILRTIQDTVVLLDPRFHLVRLNSAGERLFGAAERQLIGLPIETALGGEDSMAAAAVRRLLDSGGEAAIECTLENQDGCTTPLSCTCSPIRNEHDVSVGTVLVLRDIATQKKAEEELRFTATHDPLTGLPNRSLLGDRLMHAIERSLRSEKPFAVLLVDLDKFKDINDTFGHDAGDLVLQNVARRLQHSVRGVDTVSRLGGDEFLVVLEDIRNPADVDLVVRRIHTSIATAFSVREQAVVASASLGISLFPHDGSDPEELIQKADLALYSCKREGPGLAAFFSPEMEESNRRRIAVERGLKSALDQDELFLLYQPMVDLRSRRVVAIEALLRWRSPDLGLVGPLEFVPVAERTGLILPIGEWVLENACRQCRQWQLDGAEGVPVSVNVSVKQLWQSDFATRVARILEASELDPSLLEIEITETTALHETDKAEEVVSTLAAIGVRIVIDDFGAGHSSLARLRRLHMHALKIDRTFIQNVGTHGKDQDLVAAIISMAQRLDVGIVAEGVETQQQADALMAIAGPHSSARDVRRLQGFLYSKPVPAEAIGRLLREHRQSPVENGLQIEPRPA